MPVNTPSRLLSFGSPVPSFLGHGKTWNRIVDFCDSGEPSTVLAFKDLSSWSWRRDTDFIGCHHFNLCLSTKCATIATSVCAWRGPLITARARGSWTRRRKDNNAPSDSCWCVYTYMPYIHITYRFRLDLHSWSFADLLSDAAEKTNMNLEKKTAHVTSRCSGYSRYFPVRANR